MAVLADVSDQDTLSAKKQGDLELDVNVISGVSQTNNSLDLITSSRQPRTLIP